MSSDTVVINKNKLIASTVSIIVFGLLLSLLVFYSILPPNTDITKETRSIEIAEFNVYETTSQLEQESSKKGNTQLSNTSIQTASSKYTVASNQKTNAELLTEQFIANKSKNINATTDEDESTSSLKSNGTIGSSETTNGNRFATDNIGVSLVGRKIIINPVISKDNKEQGKVVVEIVVDNNGNVVKANPNGRGTTTASSTLKQKAQQAAMSTKFNSSSIEEQKGTITIIFSF